MLLHWSDYFIFTLSLTVYALIGIYYRWPEQIKRLCCRCRRKEEIADETDDDNQTAEEIFLGGRQMTWFPIMASTAASFFSAATLLGNHAETYLYGLPVGLSIFTNFIDKPMAAELYMPVIYKLNLATFYQVIFWKKMIFNIFSTSNYGSEKLWKFWLQLYSYFKWYVFFE